MERISKLLRVTMLSDRAAMQVSLTPELLAVTTHTSGDVS